MKHRKFGNLDWTVSPLGFGAMRLPLVDENNKADIDEEKTIEMIRYAIDHGVNYVDTAWPYHDQQSEVVVGKALQDGYREKVKLATKLPTWLVKETGDVDKYLNKQLEKLQTDHIDCYLMHTLDHKKIPNIKELGIMKRLKKFRDEGKINYIGFSFHDNFDVFKEIVDCYDWDFCQIQYNYIDTEFQAGKKGLRYAASKGLAVIIMEPLRGGLLAKKPPTAIQEIFAEAPVERTPADRALQWLWNQPEVSVVLSGMGQLQEVKENVNSAANSGINSLSKEELALIEKAGEKFREISPVNCTGCGYCLPCPQNVNIPTNFQLYNEAKIYDLYEEKLETYNGWLLDNKRADSCVQCRECEEKCPQNIEISKLMPQVAEYFSK